MRAVKTYVVGTRDGVHNDAGDSEEEKNHTANEQQTSAHCEVELRLHGKECNGQADRCRDTNGYQNDLGVVETKNKMYFLDMVQNHMIRTI